MIEYRTGNVLDADVDALVNTVNCVGVMGRGVALQFKEAWPDNYEFYADACRRNEVQPGRMLIYETRRLTNPKYIINFPTKRHWRGKSRIEDIEAGLEALASDIRRLGVQSIALPPLGAGLGGLLWSDVRQRIEHWLHALPGVRVLVYEPNAAPKPSLARKGKPPAMTAGRAALVGLMDRYLAGMLDPFVSLLEVHKLMYFMQWAGEPLRLRFAKAQFGPYAENLRHVLRAIEGYYVSGYGWGGDAPDKPLELVPGATRDAQMVLETRPESRRRFDRVAELVVGFETPFGLELLSTVHWLVRVEHAMQDPSLVEHVYGWADRKRQYSPRQIALAANVLTRHGWLTDP